MAPSRTPLFIEGSLIYCIRKPACRMLDRLQDTKVLIYSHDSFGLGHLRRCRAIAHSLVDAYKGMSVMIVSGSPIISQFDFRSRVSFICVPGIVKLRNGDYTSLGLHVDLGETLAMRAAMIQHAAEIFSPDIFLVDKEPLGLRGEVANTLHWLQLRGTINVLGLRDVMDDAEALQNEWQRKSVVPALEKLYDEIWVYGSESIVNPIQDIDLSAKARRKMRYLGYLRRQAGEGIKQADKFAGEPYILITPGGGGDGEALIDWVIRAYAADTENLPNAIIVLGPFMPACAQEAFKSRIDTLNQIAEKIEVITFHSQIEALLEGATGIVAMGGYNTFCEILSFDKRALLVPRETPRLEQRIRADFACRMGLASMLTYADSADTHMMVDALHALPQQNKPSRSGSAALLNGLDNINLRVAELSKKP